MSGMGLRATSISISTNAPRQLAEFYARLLQVEVSVSEGPRDGEPADAGWAQIAPVPGKLVMTLNFEWDEHYLPPVWPTTAPSALQSSAPAQQVMAHLDVAADDLEAAVAWALECGATEHSHQPQDQVRVMVDPHGHPFCLFVG